MDITTIIVVLLVVFITSLILLNLKKIKTFFAKFKKSKKKKSGKGKDKKGGESKNLKLQKSPTQIRPILKPPEAKKPDEKKEEGANAQQQEKKEEYTGDVKPIAGQLQNSASNANQPNVSTPSNYFSGSKFNMVPKSTKEDLDKEFDEIRKFIGQSSSSASSTSAVRPSFFGGNNNLQSGFKPAPAFQQNGQNFIKPSYPNAFPQNMNNAANPFVSNPYSQTLPAPFKGFQNGHYNGPQVGVQPKSFNSANSQQFMANNVPVGALNPSSINSFGQNTANTGAYKSLTNNNIGPVNAKTSQNVYNSFNFNDGEGYGSAKVKIDDDEIDLNKLSPNVKKLIISNILARKNFDD